MARSLHARRTKFKAMLEDNPNDAKAKEKIAKLSKRIKAGDDRPNETLGQRFRRIKKKAKNLGRNDQRDERLKNLSAAIKDEGKGALAKNPNELDKPKDPKKKKLGKPKMPRPMATQTY